MKILNSIIGLVLVSSAYGQIDRSKQPEAGPAPQINIEDSEVFTTESGITVILSENHKLPRVTFSLSLGADQELEGDLTGVSEITGSLLKSGTEHYTKDELDNAIDYIGASLNASGSSVSLSCLTKHIDKGLTLMKDVIQYPTFPQDEIDRIIKLNESNLFSVKSDAGSMASNALSVANFGKNHPYGEIMTEETLANIDRNAILSYYKRTFTPNGSYLVVVGDITKEQLEGLLKTYFDSWRGKAPYANDYGLTKPNKGNRVLFVNKPGAVQSVIYVTFPINIDMAHPDYLKLKVLNGILGGGAFSNRLMMNLREDKAFTYGCRSSLNVRNHGAWFSAGGNFRNEVTDSSIFEILYEIENVTDEYISNEELEITKASMNGSFARSLEQPSTVAAFARNIIRYNLPKDYYQTYLKKLAAITTDDLLDVAQKYFTPKNCNIIVVGNEEVLPKLMKFDSDGTIEKMDAFGNEVKDLKPADITADQLFKNYLYKVTMTSNDKKLKKKLKKLKSVKKVSDLEAPQVPGTLTLTDIWDNERNIGTKISMGGNDFMKTYYDGEKGGISSQMGNKEFDEETLDAYTKSDGYFPEINYTSTGMEFELIGIETISGEDYYVVNLSDGMTTIIENFSVKTGLKTQRKEIVTLDGQTNETIYVYDKYSEKGGFLIPIEYSLTMSGMTFSATLKEFEINKGVDIEKFK